MGAIESGRSERRLIKRQQKLSASLGELREGRCEADGTPLASDGRCKVCGKSRVREPEVELEPVHDMTEAERKFWKRYDGLLREREEQQAARAKAAEPVTPKPSRGERASEFLRGGHVILRGD